MLLGDVLAEKLDIVPTEFTNGAHRGGVKLDLTRPGEPADNGVIESFNRRLRDEFLNTHEFTSMEDLRSTPAWNVTKVSRESRGPCRSACLPHQASTLPSSCQSHLNLMD